MVVFGRRAPTGRSIRSPWWRVGGGAGGSGGDAPKAEVEIEVDEAKVEMSRVCGRQDFFAWD